MTKKGLRKTDSSPSAATEKEPGCDAPLPSNLVIQPKLTIGGADNPLEKEADATADKVMRMPEKAFIQKKCAACEEEEHVRAKPLTSFIQAKSEKDGGQASEKVKSTIESTKGGGITLPDNTKNFMENRFGADFSNVKIHTGDYAIQMSEELNAQAFTVGADIYFNSDKFRPETTEGQHLLAHELTHTIQQSGSINMKIIQRACFEEGNASRNISSCPEGATDVGRRGQSLPNALDARAEAIIATAQGAGSNEAKAIQVVNDIICSYMPSQAAKVRRISYFSSEPGLQTQSVGTGASARGDICVGDSFLNNTTRAGISRRVLQVAHELEHIEQYRTGLSGHNNRHLREFLAFYHEGLADEFEGTRRMSHSTRKALIDEALRVYHCLSDQLKADHQNKQQELLTRRQTVNGTNGNDPTTPPSSC